MLRVNHKIVLISKSTDTNFHKLATSDLCTFFAHHFGGAAFLRGAFSPVAPVGEG